MSNLGHPELQDGETLQDYVDFMNGEIPERKGVPYEDVFCTYCGLSLDSQDIKELGATKEELLQSTEKEYIHCIGCAATAQRSICG